MNSVTPAEPIHSCVQPWLDWQQTLLNPRLGFNNRLSLWMSLRRGILRDSLMHLAQDLCVCVCVCVSCWGSPAPSTQVRRHVPFSGYARLILSEAGDASRCKAFEKFECREELI